MSNGIDSQRTYALVGTGGCGKTSLAEMLLLQAGAINRLGKIEEGSTSLDYEPEEIKRRGSIQPGFASFEWNKARHFLMDIPGDGNFIGDLDILLTAADFAVFTLDAVDGVRPLTKKHWQAIKTAAIPACCFINKLDRDRADFSMAFEGLSTLGGIKPVLLYAPIGQQSAFKGLVDVLGGKALMFQADGSVTEADIPQDMRDEITTLRDTMIENIAESDETLMEKYLEEGSLSADEVLSGLRKGVLNGDLVPVMAGSALENKGGAQLLHLIEKYLPSPLDRGYWLDADANELKIDPSGPPVCFVFKTIIDPFSGMLNMARVLSGSINSESTLKNNRTGETERLGTPILLTGKNQTPTKDTVGPGAIVALAKLKGTRTCDTLADKASFALPCPNLPPQLISYALSPKEKGDEDKVFSAINKLTDEDITLKLSREETGDILLSGMGQMHIEMAVEKAKRRYKVDIVLNTPKVPYKETFKGKAQVQGRHKKQTGGRGQFGDCWVEFESLPKGSGYIFEDAIVGGSIPRQYIPAVDKGVQEASVRGYLAGYPMQDFKAKLYDGSFHNVDSSEMAFKIAGSLAFKKAMETCKPVLLEPIVTLTVSIPDAHMGDVIGDLSSRRGKVLGSDSASGITELKAHVPMSEILRYAPDLRSMTGGQGVFTAEFSHYEEAPAPVTEKVVAEYRQNKKADEE